MLEIKFGSRFHTSMHKKAGLVLRILRFPHKGIMCLLLITLVGIIITGCQADNSSSTANKDFSNQKIKVVATTSMIADLMNSIGGDRVEVAGLMGPGVDPHLYKVKVT